MAKPTQPEETKTSIDQLNDKLTDMSLKMKKNQKTILWISILAAVVIAVLLYWFMYSRPAAENKRHDAIGVADREAMMGNDSVAVEIYREVARDGGAAGNRANLNAAIILYNQGEYQQALDMVSDYSPKDEIIGAAAYSLKGDCQVNLDDLAGAVDSFKKAIKQSADNPYYTPFFMEKLARVYAAQGNYAEQVKTLEDIMAKYPAYNDGQYVNIEKELALARLKLNK